jgi:hypothetical protein
VHKRIISAVKKVELVSDRMSPIAMNVHAPTENEADNEKECFYEELDLVLHNLYTFHVKAFLGGISTPE